MPESHSLLRATIGSFDFGLPIESVVGTLHCENVQYSPASTGPAAWVLSPEEIEIWQIHSFLGLKSPRITNTPCLELTGSPRKALIVDHIGSSARAERIIQSEIPMLAWPSSDPLIAGIAIVDGHPLTVLDPEAIVKAQDRPTEWCPPNRQPLEAGSEGSIEQPSPETSGNRPSTAIGKALLVKISPGRDGEPLSLLLSLSQLEAITTGLNPVRLPHTPPFVRGVVAWQENLAYWIDWPKLLDVPALPDTGRPQRLVVAATTKGDLVVFEGDADMMMLDSETVLDLAETLSLPVPEIALLHGRVGSRRFIAPDLSTALGFQPGGSTATLSTARRIS